MSDLRIGPRVTIATSELSESFTRSTGPGGQNVNKVATKVSLRWTPATSAGLSEFDREYLLLRLASKLTDAGELIITCDEHRTQARNRAEVRVKLSRVILEALVRPKRRRVTLPTRSSVRRRLDGKKRRSDLKRSRGKSGQDD